ncbi:hypothetical protein PAXINDRAFT_13168 [Paxillus involutus ATCC 200175]|uniref:Unplaced genomic scaffold PAXINscaffold_24, whole genome shotgun sequence n=1 Tax=Paxillus involutus ATCC 200175 TaxID=664439 RepID=A0A0C9U3G8_PAXIN|nr:hypothetical protein PAXINDRAFT_13168 [Paxillus involutus ATCC 200175]
MSSANAILEGLQLFNYTCVAGVAAVCYDYILTFSCEVDLIWGKSWSTMSILFIVARYLGLALAIVSGLCVAVIRFLGWGGFIYFAVTNAIMVFRVAVMFNHPKRTTYILSFMYLLLVIEAFIIEFLWIGPDSGLIISSFTLVDDTDTLCQIQPSRSIMLPIYGRVPSALFDLLILALSVYCFAVHAIETKKRLGRIKVNVYMRLLFEHSVLYFVL